MHRMAVASRHFRCDTASHEYRYLILAPIPCRLRTDRCPDDIWPSLIPRVTPTLGALKPEAQPGPSGGQRGDGLITGTPLPGL
jgi:hypothetical protein